MSPEQAEGLTAGPASDIFSLASVLTFASRGEGPFGTWETAALLYRVVRSKPNFDDMPNQRAYAHQAIPHPPAAGFTTRPVTPPTVKPTSTAVMLIAR